jgi:hypothetical protein
MQLIQKHALQKNSSVRLALAAASASLLAGVTQAQEETPWLVDTALSVYSESDSRVTAIEPIVSLRKDMGGDRLLAMKLTLDSLTGASPSGAIASKEAQTFTGPSGNSSYSAAAGETPLDDSFKDTRVALNMNWEQPWGERNRVSVGGNFSNEYDFTSAALNTAISRDFNTKNTTLSLGLNVETDSIKPVGGTPDSLSTLQVGKNTTNKSGGTESKTVTDILFGVSQVMNRHWLTQVNFSLGDSSGYHSDPYKIVSVLNADGTLANNPIAAGKWYLYDSRPDSRSRQSIYWGNKIHLTQDVIDVSYRYHTDDWGIDSHTLDFRYRYEMRGNMYLEPHVRWYSQTAADFYRLYLSNGVDTNNGAAVLKYASADTRLGKFTGTTIGLKYGIELGRNSELNFRFEQYKQTGDVNVPSTATALNGLTLYPDLNAIVMLVGYSFEF